MLLSMLNMFCTTKFYLPRYFITQIYCFFNNIILWNRSRWLIWLRWYWSRSQTLLGLNFMWTNFLEMPMPNIIQKTPNNIWISINHFLNWPKISWTKSWELFEMSHNFWKIILNLRNIRFICRSLYSFYNFYSSI